MFSPARVHVGACACARVIACAQVIAIMGRVRIRVLNHELSPSDLGFSLLPSSLVGTLAPPSCFRAASPDFGHHEKGLGRFRYTPLSAQTLATMKKCLALRALVRTVTCAKNE